MSVKTFLCTVIYDGLLLIYRRKSYGRRGQHYTTVPEKGMHDSLKQVVTKQSESGGGVRFVSGVGETEDGVGDVLPRVVGREAEADGRRVAVRDDGDAHLAAVDVQLGHHVDDEVQQLTILGRTDRRRIVHHEHHVHFLHTRPCTDHF